MIRKNWKAFSWVEIATALLIFAIIVVFTLPNFPRYRCLAKQSEAKFEIMRILSAAELFQMQSGKIPNLPDLIAQKRVLLKNGNYKYEIASNGNDIKITATGKKGTRVEEDKWVVDKKRIPENLVDACSR